MKRLEDKMANTFIPQIPSNKKTGFWSFINQRIVETNPGYAILTGQIDKITPVKKLLESDFPGTRLLSTFLEQQSIRPREYAPPPEGILEKAEVVAGGALGQIPAFLTGTTVAKAPFIAPKIAKLGQIPKIGKFVSPAAREAVAGSIYGATRPAETEQERLKSTLTSGAFFAPFGVASAIPGKIAQKSIMGIPTKLAPKGAQVAAKKAAILGGGAAVATGAERFVEETDEDTKSKLFAALTAGATVAPFALFGGGLKSTSLLKQAKVAKSKSQAEAVNKVNKLVSEVLKNYNQEIKVGNKEAATKVMKRVRAEFNKELDDLAKAYTQNPRDYKQVYAARQKTLPSDPDVGQLADSLEMGLGKIDDVIARTAPKIKSVAKPTATKPVIMTAGEIQSAFASEKKLAQAESKLVKQKIVAKAKQAEIKGEIAKTRQSITNRLRDKFSIQIEKLQRTAKTQQLKEDIKRRFVLKIKQDVANYAKERLPISQVSDKVTKRLVGMAVKAKTQRDLTKAFFKIDNLADKVERKILRQGLEKDLKEASKLSSTVINWRYKNMIKKVLNEYNLKNYTKKTIEKLENTQKYLAQEFEAGKNVTIPKRVMETLGILTRKPLKELSNRDLQGLKIKVQTLKKLGKYKTLQSESALNAEKGQVMSDILKEGTEPLNSRPVVQREIGKELSWKDALRNRYRKALDAVKFTETVLTPVDVLFDILDGSKRYVGPLFRHFKARMDGSYARYAQRKNIIIKKFFELEDQLKINNRNYERIGVHAAREQIGGLKKLADAGYNLEQINKINLTPKELTMYNFMRKEFDTLSIPVEEVLGNVYNKPLKRVGNYFPMITDWGKRDQADLLKHFIDPEGFAIPVRGLRKTVSAPFTKERLLGKQPISINSKDIFLRHIDNASYFTEMSHDLEVLRRTMKDPRIKEKLGDKGFDLVNDWLNVISTNGRGGEQNAVMDTLRKNVTVGVLGFRLSSFLVQHTAAYDGAAYIGGEYLVKGSKNVFNKRLQKMFNDHAPELVERAGGDVTLREIANGNWYQREIAGKALAPLRKMDMVTARTVFTGAYLKKLDQLKIPLNLDTPNKEALKYANLILRRTQGSAFPKDLPLALSQGTGLTNNKSINKAMFTFQTFLLNRWSLIRHDAIRLGIKEKDPVKAARMLSWVILATLAAVGTGVIGNRAKDAFTGKEQKEDLATQFNKRLVLESAQTVPFLGSAYGSLYYGSFPIPVISTGQQAIGGGQSVWKGKKPETKAKGAIRAGTATAQLFGVPTGDIGELAAKSVGSIEKGKKSTEFVPKFSEEESFFGLFGGGSKSDTFVPKLK